MKKYHLIVFGCQMNWSDSERITTILEKNGYRKTKQKNKADLVIIISCSVRQMAIDRVYGAIRNIQKENPKTKILITGCLPEKDIKELKNKVEGIFGIKDLNKLLKIISKFKTQESKQKIINKNYLEIKPRYSTFPIAYVPIMTGCNNFCSYCVVPYTRGREISRPANKILLEIKDLIKKKYKLLVLLGQNVNSYGVKHKTNTKIKNESTKSINFPQLLRMINDLPGDFWLTFISSHPKDFSSELIEIMANSQKVMPYLHLPVQSGDNQILKKMNRHYTVTYYKKTIEQARKTIKDLNISTDIIVGFCGETKKQFTKTKELMQTIKFDMAYLAKYSPRPGTMAEKLKDSVPIQEKNKRWKILTDILKKTALENNKKYLNKKIEALITKIKKTKDQQLVFWGQTKNFKKIKLSCKNQKNQTKKIKLGKIVKTKIIKTINWGLEGVLLKE